MARTPRRYGGTNIPSQRPSKRVPYSPDIQPDIAVTKDMRGVKPSGYPARGNYTLAVYDSRLPQTIDFDTELISDNSDDVTPVNQSNASFVVPDGRTLVIKNFSCAVDALLAGTNAANRNISATGFRPTPIVNAPVVSVIVDGAPVDIYSDLVLNDLEIVYHKFESFILVPGGSTVTLRTIMSTVGEGLVFRTIWRIYGNLLLSEGDDIQQEPTNKDALPVKAGFFARLAEALERLAQ